MNYQINAELLRKRLRDQMNVLADNIATGACTSFEQYRHSAGVIEGLAKAERELLDMVEAMKKSEGDDE